MEKSSNELWRKESRVDCERVAHSKACRKFCVRTASSARRLRYATTQPRWGRGRVGRSRKAVYISVLGLGLRTRRQSQLTQINKFVYASSRLILGCCCRGMFLGFGKLACKLSEEACKLAFRQDCGCLRFRW